MGISPNGWFISENPIKMDDDWGYPHDSGNPQHHKARMGKSHRLGNQHIPGIHIAVVDTIPAEIVWKWNMVEIWGFP